MTVGTADDADIRAAIDSTLTSTAVDALWGSHAVLDEFALRYHHVVAERLRVAPEAVIARAHANLTRWLSGDAFSPGEVESLEEWSAIIDRSDAEQLIRIITEESDEGQRLRQSTPFAGVLSVGERRELLDACEERARTRSEPAGR